MDVGNLISGSFAFSKTSLNIRIKNFFNLYVKGVEAPIFNLLNGKFNNRLNS